MVNLLHSDWSEGTRAVWPVSDVFPPQVQRSSITMPMQHHHALQLAIIISSARSLTHQDENQQQQYTQETEHHRHLALLTASKGTPMRSHKHTPRSPSTSQRKKKIVQQQMMKTERTTNPRHGVLGIIYQMALVLLALALPALALLSLRASFTVIL